MASDQFFFNAKVGCPMDLGSIPPQPGCHFSVTTRIIMNKKIRFGDPNLSLQFVASQSAAWVGGVVLTGDIYQTKKTHNGS